MASSATYLYCIVRAAGAPSVGRAPRGLPGATRPALVPVGRSLWLATADVRLDQYGPAALEAALRDMSWVSEIAVAHEAVVDYFFRQARATVIPMKLFTMFSTEEKAVADIRDRRDGLDPVLKRIAGCEEWGVRLVRTAPTLSASSSGVRAASGAAFLAGKKKVRDDAREAAQAVAAAADTVYGALAGIAREARRHDAAVEGVAPPLLDAAFLLPVASRARFKAAARRLAGLSAPAGARMALTGPWPAYNFVQDETRS